MTHHEWHDQIPFYLADTLSQAQRQAFEDHLLTCESCHEALLAWQEIGQAVRVLGADAARNLPPLDAKLRAVISNPINASHLSQTVRVPVIALQVKRRFSRPVVSAAAVVLVAVAVIALLLAGDDREMNTATQPPIAQTPLALLPTSTATTHPTVIQEPGIMTQPPATQAPASATQHTTSSLPTRTRAPSITSSPAPAVQAACIARNIMPAAPAIYMDPYVSESHVGTLPDNAPYPVLRYDPNGWLALAVSEQVVWVRATDMLLEGDCDALINPLPTPTDRTPCRLIAADTVKVYAGRSPESDILIQGADPATLTVRALSEDNWYGVEFSSDGRTQIGWVDRETASITELMGDCDGLLFIQIESTAPLTPTQTVVLDVTPQDARPGDTIQVNWQVQQGEAVSLTAFTATAADAKTGDTAEVFDDLPLAGTRTITAPQTDAAYLHLWLTVATSDDVVPIIVTRVVRLMP